VRVPGLLGQALRRRETCLASNSLMRDWYPSPRCLASRRTAPSTRGSIRIAISRRAADPNGGRPTRRIARSWAGDASGMSAKSIRRCRRIGRPLDAARLARTDDTDVLAIVWPPHRIGHHEHAAVCRPAQSQATRLPVGMTQVGAIEGIRIGEAEEEDAEGGRQAAVPITRLWAARSCPPRVAQVAAGPIILRFGSPLR
jgi:hypothetical protein